MDIAVLLLWILTASAGLYLLGAGRPATVTAPSPATAAGARGPSAAPGQVSAPPGQHPLLEFLHPALGLIGLGGWIAYVVTRFGAFAWVSFGVLVVTIAAGLTWYAANRRAAAARTGPHRRHPPRRILVHGAAAGTTLVLALITLLIAVRT
ncbi:MAG TPA: hypothetical protein VGD68_10055 [Streptosporangiaceae bacterium]